MQRLPELLASPLVREKYGAGVEDIQALYRSVLRNVIGATGPLVSALSEPEFHPLLEAIFGVPGAQFA